jgi:glycosyltransferase involved in cell wall biosynthesis
MKVCHLASGDLWAGAEVVTFTLLSILRSFRELELSVIVLNHGELQRRLESLNLPVSTIPESQFNSFQLQRMIRDVLNEQKIDILHTHRYKENVLGSYARKHTQVQRHVVTVHGMPEPFVGMKNAKIQFYHWLDYRAMRRSADRVIAVSDDINRSLTKTLGPGKLITVHNGVPMPDPSILQSRSRMRKRLGIEDGEVVIGSVGRMTSVKAYDVLLKAFHLLAERRGNSRLVLMGDGPLRESLERFARSLGVGDRVTFTGFVPDATSMLPILDIFVLSSLHEGISISLLESQAMGIPAVVTNVGGNSEVVLDGINGLLAEPNQPESIANLCHKLIIDPVLRANYGNAGRVRVAEFFSEKSMGNGVFDVYKEILREVSGKTDDRPE